MAEFTEYPPIALLSNEVLSMILLNNNCREILNFGSTCKHFYRFVFSNQYLWKDKFIDILPKNVSSVVETKGQGQWLRELKRYFILKNNVQAELLTMSSKYYSRTDEISMRDVKSFFDLALAHNMNHYYVVSVLQNVVSYNEPRSTLTEIYYAKIALRYLAQTYLAIKWFQNNMRNKLNPEVVVNFFIQWTDPANIHPGKDVEASIRILVEKVEKLFPNGENQPISTVPEKIAKGLLKPEDVLNAISEVVYHQHQLALMPSANLDTLDIVKVVAAKCGHVIAVAAIYQAVANRCGVRCELIAFPNHMFLEWRGQGQALYKVDLETGTIVPRGRCPYARGPVRPDTRYCPDTFLQYIISTFLMTMGALENWSTQSATNLQDFLSTNPNDGNPYKNYQEYLLDYDHLSALTIPLIREFIDDSHLKMLEHLVLITQNSIPSFRATAVTHRDGSVLFAVGMICYHQKYNYLCVIRGWDLTCSIEVRHLEITSLRYGFKQPFYSVVAVDQSERYIPQENLVEVHRPSRLYHLEDVIGKEFSHFDGYCYVPNLEKEREYPEDSTIRAVYKNRFDLRTLSA